MHLACDTSWRCLLWSCHGMESLPQHARTRCAHPCCVCVCVMCRWYTNYAGWGAGQLEGECKRGVWFTAAASPALLLKDVSSPESGAQLW